MRYLPHTDEDITLMLEKTGNSSLDGLFACIPEAMRPAAALDLPAPMSEWALNAHMHSLEKQNHVSAVSRYFMGAGSYDHHIPAVLPYLISRSEFMTAYTPYQPEVSQGTLQGIYEFQTMICALTGMDVATASHYDGGTALAEALLVALRKKNKKTAAVSSLIHPAHKEIIRTYLEPAGFSLVEIPRTEDGRTDFSAIPSADIAGIAVQSPNFLGIIEDWGQAKAASEERGALFIASFTEALSLGILKPPGDFGADLVAGEGQSFGIAASFGGPGLGLLAASQQHMRNLPGRLVGKTTDRSGERGYVLTLATREQHIRREKASSNICSNNGLNALTAAMYLAAAGKTGIRAVAEQNHSKAAFLRSALVNAGCSIPFEGPFFNEFTLQVPEGFAETRRRLAAEHNIHAGIALEPYFPELKNHYLFCATEKNAREDIDILIREVQK